MDERYVKFGMKPFWFWNGDMRDNEIVRQIKEMADKGVGGFFITPRQGLELPYLSARWFEKVGVAIDCAKKFGVEIWLYDEYPYPSGISGGEVLNGHPEYQAVTMDVNILEVEGQQVAERDLPWGEVVMASAYQVINGAVQWEAPLDISEHIGNCQIEKVFHSSGLTGYNSKRFLTAGLAKRLYWKAPAGKWKIYIFIQTPLKHFKYFGTFIDPVNPAAVSRFIQTTHERYKKNFGHEFGKAIKGIFSDETSPIGTDFDWAPFPWSPIMPRLFLEKNGYSIVERLPALLEYMGGDTDRIRYDFRDTLVNAFIESFDMQLHDWCTENNLLYVGEKPILRSEQLKHMDIPGIDAGHQKAGDKHTVADADYRANAKMAASAAYFYNKERALCESFHSIGWSMTLQDMKWIFDWLTVQGINMFVPHAFYYTSDGLRKHDAPPSSFFQVPAWQHMKLLSDYLTGVHSSIASAKRKVDILLLDPVSSTWTAVGEKKELRERLLNDFSLLQVEILQHHFDYYIIDPQLLGQSAVKDGAFRINGDSFGILVIPPSLNIESGAMEAIEKFVQSGGILVLTGCVPVEVIETGKSYGEIFDKYLRTSAKEIYRKYVASELRQDGGEFIRNGNITFTDDIRKIPDILKEFVGKDISIESSGLEEPHILAARYEKESEQYYFFVNTSGENINTIVRLNNEKGYDAKHLTIKPLGEGEPEIGVDYVIEDGYKKFSLVFGRYQSYLLNVRDTSIEGVNAHKTKALNTLPLSLDGKWEISVHGMNYLRLDEWMLDISGREGEYDESTHHGKKKVSCKPIVDQLASISMPVPVKTAEYFGCPKQLEFPSLFCKYNMQFLVEMENADEQIWLVMEPGSIEGGWHIALNGNKISPDAFIERNFYMPTNLAADMTQFIKQGVNNIEVFVKVRNTYDGLVNPLYVAGNFGVFKCGFGNIKWKLSALPETGLFNHMEDCGLPFYAGEIEYGRYIDIDAFTAKGNEKDLLLYVDDPLMQETATLYFNGYSAGTKAWSPYRWEIDRSWVNPEGHNHVKLSVFAGLLGLFDGLGIDPVTHVLHSY